MAPRYDRLLLRSSYDRFLLCVFTCSRTALGHRILRLSQRPATPYAFTVVSLRRRTLHSCLRGECLATSSRRTPAEQLTGNLCGNQSAYTQEFRIPHAETFGRKPQPQMHMPRSPNPETQTPTNAMKNHKNMHRSPYHFSFLISHAESFGSPGPGLEIEIFSVPPRGGPGST